MSLILNAESIAAYTQILSDPGAYGFNFTPITEAFEEAVEVTPSHILADAYIKHCDEHGAFVPKVFFYVIMQEKYGQAKEKSEEGFLGYRLQFVKKNPST